ncbi:MAG: hypothetical protein OXH64_06040 [Rhodospirillaceae bacterium]|nr:hypothetical protein [Rhodospirillaceae bacterium]
MKERLVQERDTLLHEREALDNQIKGLERAIALYADDEAKQKSGKRQPIKGVVLELLEDVGTTGLNATTAVTLAEKRGITLERASVSSLLSRLKADGIVEFDGTMYRLPKYVGPKATADPFGAVRELTTPALHTLKLMG